MQGAGKCYAAAHGSRIENEGEKFLLCQARNRSNTCTFRKMKVQVGDVNHGLMSLADLVDSCYRVGFEDEEFGSYAEHKETASPVTNGSNKSHQETLPRITLWHLNQLP